MTVFNQVVMRHFRRASKPDFRRPNHEVIEPYFQDARPAWRPGFSGVGQFAWAGRLSGLGWRIWRTMTAEPAAGNREKD
jgi:hypothetical protein